MENNKNKKSVKFQGDTLNFCDFIQVFVFTPNHHLNGLWALRAVLIKKLTIGKSIKPCTGIELDVSHVPVFLCL